MPLTMTTTLSDLIATLSSPTMRVRVGLWLASQEQLDRITEEGVRLGIATIDLRKPILDALLPRQRFLGLGVDQLLLMIDQIAREQLTHHFRLLYHVDLVLARFTRAERSMIWRQLYEGLPHRPHPVLIAMPKGADHLLPTPVEQDAWRAEGRLAL